MYRLSCEENTAVYLGVGKQEGVILSTETFLETGETISK